MKTTQSNLQRRLQKLLVKQGSGVFSASALVLTIALIAAIPRPAAAQNAYLQHNLVSDLPGLADVTDTNLVNPWGISFSATSPFWIADNGTGLSTLYNSTGAIQSLVVTI